LGWAAVAGAQPEYNAVGLFRFVVAGDAAWDPRAFDLAKDVSRAAGATGVLDAVDPDLRPFFARGGRLLLYHGWADPQTPPGNTIAYRQRVLETSGADATDNLRLFMVPGMGHCEGGPGTDRFDEVDTMARWLDSGVAPSSIEAAHATAGTIDRTRPLCAFGTVARWDGRGDPDASSSFSCVAAPQGVRP
jgi:feruloyl esterase